VDGGGERGGKNGAEKKTETQKLLHARNARMAAGGYRLGSSSPVQTGLAKDRGKGQKSPAVL